MDPDVVTVLRAFNSRLGNLEQRMSDIEKNVDEKHGDIDKSAHPKEPGNEEGNAAVNQNNVSAVTTKSSRVRPDPPKKITGPPAEYVPSNKNNISCLLPGLEDNIEERKSSKEDKEKRGPSFISNSRKAAVISPKVEKHVYSKKDLQHLQSCAMDAAQVRKQKKQKSQVTSSPTASKSLSPFTAIPDYNEGTSKHVTSSYGGLVIEEEEQEDANELKL